MNQLKLTKPRSEIRAALTALATSKEKVEGRIHGAFRMIYDLAVAAKVPRDKDGVKVLSEAIRKYITQDADTINLATGAGYKVGTLGQYASGLKRAYVAGIAWNADSHSKAPPFPWKKKEEKSDGEADAENVGTGAAADKVKTAKPGKVESVTLDGVRAEATQLLAHLRQLGMVDVAEKILDAIIASPLKPTPPAK